MNKEIIVVSDNSLLFTSIAFNFSNAFERCKFI